MRIYLDNCCYNRPYDEQTQTKIFIESQAKLHIQKLITENKLDLVYSFVSVYENSMNPYEVRRTAISDFFKYSITYVSENNIAVIKNRAAEIMKTGIKTKDAMHLSCAIEGNADYFISTDIRLLKYSSDQIKLINPVDFLYILEG
ncbi:MAG: hypothetical protein K6C13_13060 [Oscillospiraceae bacterium]|nr:hypothetical protein [Oscillospiraceae bacterium]